MTIAVLPLFGLAIDRRGLDTGLTVAALSIALAALAVFAVWWRAGDHASAAAEAHPVV